jgi:hypothetical protein
MSLGQDRHEARTVCSAENCEPAGYLGGFLICEAILARRLVAHALAAGAGLVRGTRILPRARGTRRAHSGRHAMLVVMVMAVFANTAVVDQSARTVAMAIVATAFMCFLLSRNRHLQPMREVRVPAPAEWQTATPPAGMVGAEIEAPT